MSPNHDPSEAGAANLCRAIRQLPLHEPDPTTWNRIADQLATSEALARAIPDLPTHEPDEALWSQIAAQLDSTELPQPTAAIVPKSPAVVRTLSPIWSAHPVRRALALAASVLMVLGVFWWQRPVASGPRETIAFSEEEIVTEPRQLPAAIGSDPLAGQGLAFIDARCSSQPGVCGSGEFRSLRSQLAELEVEQARLRRNARRFGESPELRREQVRLVTLQASITRELVQLLIS